MPAQRKPEAAHELTTTSAPPATLGMSSVGFSRLEDHLKRRYLESGRFPGTQTLVYRRGHIAHSAVQGYADLERKVPM